MRDINSGTFGFVELALDKLSGQHVAIKFIDRGEKVQAFSIGEGMGTSVVKEMYCAYRSQSM